MRGWSTAWLACMQAVAPELMNRHLYKTFHNRLHTGIVLASSGYGMRHLFYHLLSQVCWQAAKACQKCEAHSLQNDDDSHRASPMTVACTPSRRRTTGKSELQLDWHVRHRNAVAGACKRPCQVLNVEGILPMTLHAPLHCAAPDQTSPHSTWYPPPAEQRSSASGAPCQHTRRCGTMPAYTQMRLHASHTHGTAGQIKISSCQRPAALLSAYLKELSLTDAAGA